MRHRTLPQLFAASALAFATLLVGCMDGPLTQHQGDRGYPCYEHAECIAPLLCLSVPSADFPVCTGSELEGAACNAEKPCAWLRDYRGLPLACIDATCGYPPDELSE